MTTETGFIPSHGNYTELLSYKKSLIVYSGTVLFCERFLNKRDRTVDQMVQAARSGKQNIIEGTMASATSKETEIKLTNVARASQEELLEDSTTTHSAAALRPCNSQRLMTFPAQPAEEALCAYCFSSRGKKTVRAF